MCTAEKVHIFLSKLRHWRQYLKKVNLSSENNGRLFRYSIQHWQLKTHTGLSLLMGQSHEKVIFCTLSQHHDNYKVSSSLLCDVSFWVILLWHDGGFPLGHRSPGEWEGGETHCRHPKQIMDTRSRLSHESRWHERCSLHHCQGP